MDEDAWAENSGAKIGVVYMDSEDVSSRWRSRNCGKNINMGISSRKIAGYNGLSAQLVRE